MKKIVFAIFLTVTLACFPENVSAWIWPSIGSGVQPATRDLITDIHENLDPSKYAVFMDDFFQFPQAAMWDTTSVVVDAGSLVETVDSLGVPGCLKITLGADNKGILNGMNIQTSTAPFKIIGSPANPDTTNVAITYEAKVMFNNATQSEIYAGLTIEDEALNTGHSYGLLFVKHDNSTTLYAKEIKANTSAMDSASCGTVANRTWYRLRIEWNGASAKYYVNDVYKQTLSTVANQPVGVHLKPTLEFAAGDSVQSFAYVDYVYTKQRR